MTYANACIAAKGIPCLNWTDPGCIGVICGKCRVVQVIDSRTALVDVLDKYGLPKTPFILSGVDTSQWVDGTELRLSNILVEHKGTQSYTTVLGANRQVYRVDVIDSEQLKSAVREYKEDLRATVEALRDECERIERIIAIEKRLKMVRPMAELNKKAAQEVERLESELMELGPLTDQERKAYKDKKARLDAQTTLINEWSKIVAFPQ